ncbi:hypothetical protein COU61_04930 [Candidatus Pacearchaeota archaeon CG10_big_fil_rev_8_21_14_0_10_35_13]|nr:MAG: hypothetical protein COU61_04930 [Candidatus Pacearchaeota archaeon CG10_big_fil_rev_8_21_14_0_10_35_13]
MPEVDHKMYEKVAKFDSTLVENMEILSSMDNYYDWITSWMRRFSGKRILDLGCGNGNLTNFFRDKELVVGLDYSKDYIKIFDDRFKGVKNFSSALVDATDEKAMLALKKLKFDTVITMNALEHIPNDQPAFDNVYKLLDKGGRFVIVVPAFGFLYSILDYEGGHFRRYTKKEIVLRLKKAGFKVEKIHYMNFAGAAGWWLIHKMMKKRIYSKGTFGLYNSLVPTFKFFENLIKPPVGLSVFAVARKV